MWRDFPPEEDRTNKKYLNDLHFVLQKFFAFGYQDDVSDAMIVGVLTVVVQRR